MAIPTATARDRSSRIRSLSEDAASQIWKASRQRKDLTLPSYPALESSKKVSAAWLVEHSGFSRGYTLGHVGISSKHALAIVNRGGATAAEILALKNQIQQRVEETWGVRLEPEPVLWLDFRQFIMSPAHVVPIGLPVSE